MYKRIDGLDKNVKPLILKWLSELFGYKNYPNSFKDQWISWSIWDGQLSVSFDLRQQEHLKLLSLIHPRFIGIPQIGTLKIVNDKSFYLDIERLLYIDYPEITESKLLKRNKERGGTGGWHSLSDDFYTYDWEVSLSDETSIYYHNQEDKMEMVKGDYTYLSIIQERAFVNFLQKYI